MDKHILLIEDDPGVAHAYLAGLRSQPTWRLYHANMLSSARTVLQSLDAEGIHCALIILDVNLPDSLGLAGIVNLRAFVREVTDGHPHVPIVALTGVEDPELRDEILRWGVQKYHVKGTMSLAVLRAIVREVLQNNGADNIPQPE